MSIGPVSVILPVYNGASTIEAAINSVLYQGVDLELIIINDGSTDQLIAILEKISDPRIKYFAQRNAGVSAARNHGLARAANEWVAFIDADDVWGKDKLKKQLVAADTAQVVFSDCTMMQNNRRLPQSYAQLHPCPDLGQSIIMPLLQENFIPLSTVMVDKQAALKAGGFDPSIKYGEDYDLYLRLALSGVKFVRLREELVNYNINPESASAMQNHAQNLARIYAKVAHLSKNDAVRTEAKTQSQNMLRHYLLTSPRKDRAKALIYGLLQPYGLRTVTKLALGTLRRNDK